MPDYTTEHARAGIKTKLPALETWPNQFPGYVITTRFPILLRLPQDRPPRLRHHHHSIHAQKRLHRAQSPQNVSPRLSRLGIFYENAVNKILHDIVAAVRPNGASSAANSHPAAASPPPSSRAGPPSPPSPSATPKPARASKSLADLTRTIPVLILVI